MSDKEGTWRNCISCQQLQRTNPQGLCERCAEKVGDAWAIKQTCPHCNGTGELLSEIGAKP
jgi:DnaJ-class molecular chaperone